jgi:phosphate transport system substrate-binding protein
MKKRFALVTAAWILSAVTPAAFAEVVRLHGATTVMNVVVNPNRAAVEKATGHTLEIVGNATGKGLVDLAAGSADAAMVSEPLEIAVEAAAAAGKQIDIKTLQMHEIRKDEVMFIVHPANPVASLSWDQVRDIHVGKITNWKTLGGKDQAITVYSDATTGGTRALVRHLVLGGQEYAPAVKAQLNVKRVAEVVAVDESGFGAAGRSFVDAAKVKPIQTRKLERPLGFVTVGAPSPKVAAVIGAFKSTAK